jgi:hypothetical protein
MKDYKSIIGVMVLIGVFILGTATVGGAQVIPKGGDQWQSYFGAYFWVPGVNGTVGVNNLKTDLDWEMGGLSHEDYSPSEEFCIGFRRFIKKKVLNFEIPLTPQVTSQDHKQLGISHAI